MRRLKTVSEKVTRMVEVVEEVPGKIQVVEEAPFDALLGKEVCVICTSYIYHGKLTGINDEMLELSNPSIVYQTGAWSDKKWADAQKLPTPTLPIFFGQIESGPFEISKGG